MLLHSTLDYITRLSCLLFFNLQFVEKNNALCNKRNATHNRLTTKKKKVHSQVSTLRITYVLVFLLSSEFSSIIIATFSFYLYLHRASILFILSKVMRTDKSPLCRWKSWHWWIHPGKRYLWVSYGGEGDKLECDRFKICFISHSSRVR